MKRTHRQVLAQETLEILQRGFYLNSKGEKIDLAEQITQCKAYTRMFSPRELERFRKVEPIDKTLEKDTVVEVVNETTLEGIHQLLLDGAANVAALNFASAKNPGGGFLNGSQAQEESLARSSALYVSLQQADEYYQIHRSLTSYLYTDTMIYSPACPIFRNDEGTLLDQPEQATFLTSAAPNAGAIADRRPQELPLIRPAFQQRAELVLALANRLEQTHLVLGAWGCGVFRNDPEMVAEIFAQLLRSESWKGRFTRIRFSVYDRSADQGTYQAFASHLGGSSTPE